MPGNQDSSFIIVLFIIILAVLGAFWFLGGISFSLPTSVGTGSEAVILGGEAADAPAPVESVENNRAGEYLVDPDGMTLYVAAHDGCTQECLRVWPPYVAASKFEATGMLGVVERKDTGQLQYTWKDKLLYYFSGDRLPNDVYGNGIGSVWFVARP